MNRVPIFPPAEYDRRIAALRAVMQDRDIDGCVISSPENIYYLCGLDHMGYFAYQALVVPRDGDVLLVSRAMEKATVRDQVPHLTHVGYADGSAPPKGTHPDADLVFATTGDDGRAAGLRPWEMSFGVAARAPGAPVADVSGPVAATVDALSRAGLSDGKLVLEMANTFLPYKVVQALFEATPKASWSDGSGLVDDLRVVQSPLELERTRAAARVSDAMMLSAIAAAGKGQQAPDIMAALYDTMFRFGGTYPGFVPLVRDTRTLQHEHGTWQANRLRNKDVLFLEMAGCIRRYHAPLGRLVFIGSAPKSAEKMNRVCLEAMGRAAGAIKPGVEAREVYAAWHSRLDEGGLKAYTRHHCGYAVGIGYPPSWSGSGVPVGLRSSSTMKLRAGMVFHLMSWLLRTGKGDSFLSDTVVVTETGCEWLTSVGRDVVVRR